MVFDWRFFFTVIVGGVAMALSARAMFRLYRLARLARDEKMPMSCGKRVMLFARDVLAQGKLFKDFWPGLQHAIIFWGFMVITLGTTEMILNGLFHGHDWGFTWKFLGTAYDYLVVTEDWLHALVLLAVGYGLWRRFVTRPARFGTDKGHKKDAVFVLCLTGSLMLANILSFAGFVYVSHVSVAAGGEPHYLAHLGWRPVSEFVAANLFFPLSTATGWGPQFFEGVGWFFWAVHLSIVFFFAYYIPHSKHLHVMAAGPNIFLARLRHRGTFSQINFEDESNPQFGVGKITQFTWKDVLDLYSCTQCGRCNEFCPTANTAKPLRPMELIEDLKNHLFEVGDDLIKNKQADPKHPLVVAQAGDVTKNSHGQPLNITEDTIWACTTCKACVEACPVHIEHVDKIVDMRRNLVLMEGKMPMELQNTMKNWEVNSNPWGIAPDIRDEWAKDLNIPRLKDKPDAEYLFYVGCAGSFNDRNKKISTSVVKILKKAGVDFAILGKEELCNGETARRAGNEYLAKTMIDANVAVLKNYNVKKIISTCPHCFNTLKNEYPDFGFQAESVVHHTEFIETLIAQGKLRPVLGADGKESKDKIRVAFHDSCYLGRYNEVYEAPRKALASVPGVEVIELPRNRQKGLCCGAGGARMWMEETIGKRINVERVDEAVTVKPDVIAAACPYCQVMLEDGVKEKTVQPQVKDVAEILADSLA